MVLVMTTPRSNVEPWERAITAARTYAETTTDWVGPDEEQLAALAEFSPRHLDEPLSGAEAIDLLASVGGPATMRTTGGRYFGFVNGGTHPTARAAAVLAGTWDQNTALSTMAPSTAHIDRLTGKLVIDLLGLPETAVASFCGGASIANLTAVLVARDELLRRCGHNVAEQGLARAPRIAVVVGDEAHITALRALRLAGFGLGRDLITIPADDLGQMQADALSNALSGLDDETPVLLMAQAGNVNTGGFDPLDAIADVLDETVGPERRWIHVDGAFGLWAAAAPNRKHLTVGVERADSWATDGHKYPNTPYDCGIAICADEVAMRRAMSLHGAAYAAAADGEHDPMNLGLQMSQAARAVPLWAVLATEGRFGMAERIERACVQAQQLALGIVEELPASAELLAPVVLNQALVSFTDRQGTDCTDAVVSEIQQARECWMGATTWQGRRAVRISVSSLATTDDDIAASIGAVVAAAHRVLQN